MEENLLAVFNERDPQRRLEVIRRNYAPDVRWADGDAKDTAEPLPRARSFPDTMKKS